jgi:hypothetical protein
MGKQDAQKNLGLQMIQPRDPETAPHKIPFNAGAMLKRLREWEKARRLSIDYKIANSGAFIKRKQKSEKENE